MKELVIKVHSYFENERINGRESINVAQTIKRTSDCLGISISTVKRVLREKREFGVVMPIKSKSGRKK